MKPTSKILSLALLSSLLCASAQAANFYVVTPNKSKAALLDKISVSLATYTLPAGKVGSTYPGVDFNSLLQVTGDSSFSSAGVAWSATNVPPGLTLSPSGVLSGTPSVKNTAGTSFQVVAAYKTKSGQQAYTLVVNGQYLEAVQIAAGTYHACAVTTTGGLKCWGFNGNGQLGDGTTINRNAPVDVVGLGTGVQSAALGAYHSCALLTTGGVKCWGYNGGNALGDGTSTSSATPVDVSRMTGNVASIAAGSWHTCAVMATFGSVKCWGDNSSGQLGNGTTTTPTERVTVSGISNAAMLSLGDAHSCVVTATGGLLCWGANGNGQLGDGTTTMQTTPVGVSGLSSGVSSVVAANEHTCAVTSAGAAKCWGFNGNYELGDGTNVSRSTPTQVAYLSSGVAFLGGNGDAQHHCAVLTSGSVQCWGRNNYGQVGNGGYDNQSVPVPVTGLPAGLTKIVGGLHHTCALSAGHDVLCWGSNYTLGNGTTDFSPTPVNVVN